MQPTSSRFDRRSALLSRHLLGSLATVAAGLGGCSLIANLGQFDGATGQVDADVEGSVFRDAPIGSDQDAASLDASLPETSLDSSADATSPDSTAPDSADGATADSASADAAADGADDGAGAGNLIQNPGFERGISPWTTFSDGTNVASIAVSSAHAHSGSYSGWVTNRTRNFQGTAQDIRLAAVQGHTYTASAWAMVAAPADAGDGAADDAAAPTAEPVDMTAAFTCMVDGAQAVSYTRVGAATATSTGWSQIAGTFTVPICTMTALQVYVEGPEPGVDLFVDDVSVLP